MPHHYSGLVNFLSHCHGRRYYSIVKKCIIKLKRNIYFSFELLIYEHKYLKQGWNYIDQKVIMNNSVSQYNNIKLFRTANSPTSYKSKKLIVSMMKEDKRSTKEPVISNDIEQFNIVAKYKLNEISFIMRHVSSTGFILTWRQINKKYFFPKPLINVTSKLLPAQHLIIQQYFIVISSLSEYSENKCCKDFSGKYITGRLKSNVKNENKGTGKKTPVSSKKFSHMKPYTINGILLGLFSLEYFNWY